MKFHPKQVLFVSFIAFVLSGFSGLIYQSIWTRYLSLVLGHAAFAQTLVLALFMGGMAFGAWWASRLSSKHGLRVLKTYAAIEIIVGIAALIFHPVFVHGTEVVQNSILPNLGSGFLIGTVKWSWAALLILPQCILLGMTFPLLSTGLIRLSDKVTGEILGTLYFTNSIGAAVGALVATFLLIPAIGLPGAMITAGGVNFIAGLLVLLVSIGEAPTPKVTAPVALPDSTSHQFARLVLICAFFTGLSSFVYEIAWVRMLALALGSTVHAFEIMISTFVAGLAVGSFFIRKRIDKQTEPLVIAGWAQILMGIAALSTIFSYKLSFYGVENLVAALTPTEGGYTLFNLASAAIAMLLMFPTAFFAGMTLPVFTATLLRAGAGEQAIGKVYAANTIGAIVGVFIAVHLLLPFLGLKSSILLAALIDIVLGVVIFHKLGLLQKITYTISAGLAGVAVVVSALAPKLDERMLVSGVYRLKRSTLVDNAKVVYYRDGKTATISAIVDGSSMSIATNGKVDAAVQMNPQKPPSADEETMVMLGLLPLLYQPQAKTGANIGFGSGVTTHTILGSPSLKALDTIEIEPAMIEGAQVFGQRTARAYADPRSNVIVDDAKTYFSGNNKRYDFIVSEPSNPWVSGVASLFSEEFYKFLPRHLNEDGVLVQWIQLYEIDFSLIASILKALNNNFSDYHMYIANSSDLIIVAKHKGSLGDKSAAPFSYPMLSAELSRQGIRSLNDVNMRFVANKKTFEPSVNAAPLAANSDYYPVVSHLAPKTRFLGATASEIYELPYAYIPHTELLSASIGTSFTTQGLSHQGSTQKSMNPKVFYMGLALEMQAVLVNKSASSTITNPDMRNQVDLILLARRNCSAMKEDLITLNALIKVGAFMASSLPSAEASNAIQTDPLGCGRENLPAHFNLTQDFLAAVAKRDITGMEIFGKQILIDPQLQKREMLAEMALCAATIALLKQNKRPEALKLMAQHSEVPFAPDTRALRKLLVGIVQAK